MHHINISGGSMSANTIFLFHCNTTKIFYNAICNSLILNKDSINYIPGEDELRLPQIK